MRGESASPQAQTEAERFRGKIEEVMAMADEAQGYLEYDGHRLYRWFVHCRNHESPLIAWGESEKAVKAQLVARGEHVLLIEAAPPAEIK